MFDAAGVRTRELGGPGAETLGRVLWTEFFTNRDWPTAAALAMVLLAVTALPAALWQRRRGQPGSDGDA